MHGALTFCAIAVPAALTLFAVPLRGADDELTWESANERRMFVLANDGHWTAAIVADTTHEEDLAAALKLQSILFRLSGARLPIVDREFAGDRWHKIHLAWDHHPMRPREHAFIIEMQENDPTLSNPLKQVVISGAPPGKIEDAVSGFTEAAFGVPLEALDDDDFEWKRTAVLALPEDYGPIYAERSGSKGKR